MTEDDRALAALSEQHGQRWEVWVVHRVVGGPVWCARLHTNHRRLINTDTADHLDWEIREAERETAGPEA